MEFIVKSEGTTSVPRLEDGVYTAVSSMLIDIGGQQSAIDNKVRRKFMMVWTILNEFIEVNGEQLPRIISKEYTLSLNEKSNLRKDLQAWRGKAFTEEELQGFNLLTIMNKPCQLQIINEERNGSTYNNISAIMSMPKGMKVDELEETTVFLLNNNETWRNWEKIPKWIQEKIKKSEGYNESDLKMFIDEYEKANKASSASNNVTENEDILATEDDLPF